MSTTKQLVEQFYTAFAASDAEAMIACYHPELRFSDPVFVDLDAREAGGMWRMLCARAKEFSLEFSDVHADDELGRAHWEARYLFSATGRKVHNIIDAEFRFAEGKIIEHRDHFDFYRWSRHALGAPGLLLGWTSMLRNKVRGQAREGLEQYLAKHA